MFIRLEKAVREQVPAAAEETTAIDLLPVQWLANLSMTV